MHLGTSKGQAYLLYSISDEWVGSNCVWTTSAVVFVLKSVESLFVIFMIQHTNLDFETCLGGRALRLSMRIFSCKYYWHLAFNSVSSKPFWIFWVICRCVTPLYAVSTSMRCLVQQDILFLNHGAEWGTASELPDQAPYGTGCLLLNWTVLWERSFPMAEPHKIEDSSVEEFNFLFSIFVYILCSL